MADRLDQRTAEFREAIITIASVETLPYNIEILQDRRLLSAGLLVKNALYVRDSECDLAMCFSDGLEFEPNAARLQGNTNSHHGVIFGKLHSDEDVIEVAVKPYDGGRAAAVREHTAYEFMLTRGYESLVPLGILACNGNAFLLTIDEPSLKTFDNMQWSPAALSKGDIGSEQVELLRAAGNVLGKWHADDTTHGDAEPKNTAMSERGKVGFIDLESMQHSPSSASRESINGRKINDLLCFYGKLSSAHGYCRGQNAKKRMEKFESDFFDNYIDAYKSNVVGQKASEIRRTINFLRVNVMKYILSEQKGFC